MYSAGELRRKSKFSPCRLEVEFAGPLHPRVQPCYDTCLVRSRRDGGSGRFVGARIAVLGGGVGEMIHGDTGC